MRPPPCPLVASRSTSGELYVNLTELCQCAVGTHFGFGGFASNVWGRRRCSWARSLELKHVQYAASVSINCPTSVFTFPIPLESRMCMCI